MNKKRWVGSLKMPTMSTSRVKNDHVEVSRWSKKGQNCVHVVIECPLSTLFVLLFVDSSETLYVSGTCI